MITGNISWVLFPTKNSGPVRRGVKNQRPGGKIRWDGSGFADPLLEPRNTINELKALRSPAVNDSV